MRRRITTAKREEIEKEQKLLDSTIVRPFETLNGLPISYNEPPYSDYGDILKNPLTIKDSSVLYNALIRSRNSYVQHAPMFKLYWVKQTAYAKKLADMEKANNKRAPPKETRRRFAKATTNSLETRTRTPVLSADINARDVMSKLWESSITLGPHTMDIRIFIAKDARSEKSRAFAELSRVSENGLMDAPPLGGPLMPPTIKQEPMTMAPAAEIPQTGLNGAAPGELSASGTPAAPSLPQTSTPGEDTSANATPVEGTPAEETAGSSKTADEAADQSAPEAAPEAAEEATEEAASGPTSSAASPVAETKKGTAKPAEESKPAAKKGGRKAAEPTKKSKQKEQVDETPKSKEESAPPSSDLGAPPPSSDLGAAPPPSELGAPPPGPPRPPAANLQSIDNTIMISNLNAIAKIDLSLNDLMKEVALGKASETQITLFKKYIERAKQMGPQPHHADLYLSRGLPLPMNFPRPYPVGAYVNRNEPPRHKFSNPMKLTAFQEKYLHNATLVFEFLENPNVRYVIPRDSICEILEPAHPPIDAEEDSEFNDVLISHIWIHNIDEVEAYERKLSAYYSEVKQRQIEEERKRKEEEEAEKQAAENEEEGQEVLDRNRAKKKAPPPKKKKPLVAPEEPHIRYTTLSFTIHNIPTRFIPIVANSMKPLKQVQDRMKHILKVGTRVPSFYLWYQIDARLDEEFAENLRSKLVTEEKKMIGIPLNGGSMEPKKRKPREFKNPRVKRLKDSASPPPYSQPPYGYMPPAPQYGAMGTSLTLPESSAQLLTNGPSQLQ